MLAYHFHIYSRLQVTDSAIWSRTMVLLIQGLELYSHLFIATCSDLYHRKCEV
ncbi:hypothetical protein M747DRAFT_35444 [Aspergillus niger ATCC 13496]|uniref:Uncharacterized protein n=1 Tax=Aspergillus niger ATCC 13496 TaxID=1353008 RepID=A0A370BY37_ASPNG|nr:hypothetical protein M747DRAFT_35444 [Aspergillus niger ATCC 13496]